tara:strand:+ start:205 stop:471 length:267 start_codon:yes stop_codon:yes gene_type:complete
MGTGKWSKAYWPDDYKLYQGNNQLIGDIKQLEKGDIAYSLLNNALEPIRISSLGKYNNENFHVYTFTQLTRNKAFFAENILVGVYGKN